MSQEIALSGDVDSNREILMRVPQESLKDVCVVNTQLAALCDNHFWHLRFTQDFVELGQPENSFDYRELYWRVIAAEEDGLEKLIDYIIKEDMAPLFAYYFIDPAIQDNFGDVVENVIATGSLKILRYLFEEEGLETSFEEDGEEKFWPTSVVSSNLEAVRYLVETVGVNITHNAEDHLGEAIRIGTPAVFEYLWKRMRDIEHLSLPDADLIIEAARYGNVEILDYLIRNIGPTQSIVNDAFETAAAYTNVSAMKRLLEAGAVINGSKNDGKPLLRILTSVRKDWRDRQEAVVRFLIDSGVRINNDVIQQLVSLGNFGLLEYLLTKLSVVTPETLRMIDAMAPFKHGSSERKALDDLLKRYGKEAPQIVNQDVGATLQAPQKHAEAEPILPPSTSSITKEPSVASVKQGKRPCAAKTKIGDPCKKCATKHSEYCSVHQKK